jgi:signal recognition particle subunit SEC65
MRKLTKAAAHSLRCAFLLGDEYARNRVNDMTRASRRPTMKEIEEEFKKVGWDVSEENEDVKNPDMLEEK